MKYQLIKDYGVYNMSTNMHAFIVCTLIRTHNLKKNCPINYENFLISDLHYQVPAGRKSYRLIKYEERCWSISVNVEATHA